MCLGVITDPKPDPKAKGTGDWKVLACYDGKLESPCYCPKVGAKFWNSRTWRRAGDEMKWTRSGPGLEPTLYRAGIHLYCTRKAARASKTYSSYAVRQVEWQGLICRGTEGGHDVLVVERARLLEKKE